MSMPRMMRPLAGHRESLRNTTRDGRPWHLLVVVLGTLVVLFALGFITG